MSNVVQNSRQIQKNAQSAPLVLTYLEAIVFWMCKTARHMLTVSTVTSASRGLQSQMDNVKAVQQPLQRNLQLPLGSLIRIWTSQ